jgi:urease accessory protein
VRCWEYLRPLLLQQVNTLQVAAGASLEWFPQETLVYRGAVASLETRVELADDARFIGWELIALGLPASGIKFDDGSFTQRFVISRNGLPLLIERMHIEGSSLTFRAGMAALQGHSLSGTFVCGPFADKMLDDSQIAALRERLQLESGALAALTVLGEFVVLRYLGSCSEEARRCFVRCWKYLRPLLLQRAACAPRIWAT